MRDSKSSLRVAQNILRGGSIPFWVTNYVKAEVVNRILACRRR